jgi:predicted transglutaminase-like cysteine proteinase
MPLPLSHCFRWSSLGLLLVMLTSPMLLIADKPVWVAEKLIQDARRIYGRKGGINMERWRDMLEDAAGTRDDEDLLDEVNMFFNRNVPFVSDLEHWKQIDYWATPFELLGTNGGDCEDYVISKYYSLIRLGMDESKLRITYVKALDYNQAHMVLAYYARPNAVPLILDNLTNRIRKATDRKDLKPVYSFNGQGMWLTESKGLGARLGESNQLDRWTDLRVRMARIGMDL